jgi:hypothetical protein
MILPADQAHIIASLKDMASKANKVSQSPVRTINTNPAVSDARDPLLSRSRQDGSRPSTALGHSRSSSMGSGHEGGGNSVFDRLCDTTKYVGTHKHRFDENGRGRGLFGRDSVPKGNTFGTPNALEIYQRARYQAY